MKNQFRFPLALLVLPLFISQASILARQVDDAEAAPFEQRIRGYVDAFNNADATALANFWSEEGEFVTSTGERWAGRSAIAEQFATWFADVKEAQLELLDPQVEVQSPSVAVETGIARLSLKGEKPEESEYRAILIKTPDGWKIDSVREAEAVPPPPSHVDQLQSLAWMVGNWSAASEGIRVDSSCRWSTNQNFLIQSFRVVVDDRVDFEGTQVIGWDPRAESIRSWIFDSDGGFGAGRWSEGEGRWTVQTLSVTPDGRTASATNVYELIDENSVRYSSSGRQVENELVANVDPVVIQRVSEVEPIE